MRRTVLLLRCRPGVQFHLGERSLEDSSELLHADTLFSALTNTWALAYEDVDAWVEAVRVGAVRLSSGLHCVEFVAPDGERAERVPREPLYFVPAPPLRWRAADGTPLPPRGVKRVRYVSLGVLSAIRRALRAPDEEDDLPACELDLLALPRLAGGYACTAEELVPTGAPPPDLPFLVRETRPRLQARSLSVLDSYYHAHAISFAPVPLPDGGTLRGHFYVVVDEALGDALRERFLTCLRLLADEGVGGERTAGYGWFEGIEVREAPAALRQVGGGACLSLSPVVPADEAELARALHYALVVRGGGSLGVHGDAERHRAQVRMMREGALFRAPIEGRLVTLFPRQEGLDHDVLRNGRCFPLALEGKA